MSGRKRIYVDEGEWDRLRREAAELAQVQRDLPRLMDQVRARTEADIARSMAEIDQRQAGFERAVCSLSEQTRRVEQETAKRLQENAHRLRRELSVRDDAIRTETSAVLREQRLALEQAVADERAARQRALAAVEGRVAAAEERRGRVAELTRGLFDDALVLREQVAAYPHERYLPGELGKIDVRLDSVRSNVESGIGDVGLVGAQLLCTDLGALRLDLERLDREWRTCQVAALRELLAMQGLIEQNATVQVTGAAAPSVDEWSRGALSRLAGDVDAKLAQVRDTDQPLSTEELARIVDDLVPELEVRLETVVRQAVSAVHASQLRANLADLIADALDKGPHYEVTTYGYAGGDQRNEFMAKSEHHVTGNEMVIEVAPGPTDDSPPTVRLHSYDKDGATEEERTARFESVRRSVREQGGPDLSAVEEDTQPDLSRQNVEVIVRPAPQGATATGSASRPASGSASG